MLKQESSTLPANCSALQKIFDFTFSNNALAVNDQLDSILQKYRVSNKDSALSLAITNNDVDAINLLIKKYSANTTNALYILGKRYIDLEIYWSGHQLKEYKEGNSSVDSFVIAIGNEKYIAHLSCMHPKGVYEEPIRLYPMGSSRLFPTDFGHSQQASILTGRPIKSVSARYGEISCVDEHIIIDNNNIKLHLPCDPTLKNQTKYRLNLRTDQFGNCTATLIEVGYDEKTNSALVLHSKLMQTFSGFFVLKLNSKKPGFFPNQKDLNESKVGEIIKELFNRFVQSLDKSEQDLLAYKAELDDISPFISQLVGTNYQKFKQLITDIYALQSSTNQDPAQNQKQYETLANLFVNELTIKYAITDVEPVASQLATALSN